MHQKRHSVTGVLVPAAPGLFRLFSTKEVPEDQKVMVFVEAQCNSKMESTYCNMMSNSRLTKRTEPFKTVEDQMREKIPLAEQNKKSDDSNPDDENANDGKYRIRIGKGHQAKNLETERKRRRKINDKLYSLRASVPNISKLDRAAILDDAIDYAKELQKQANDLQIELEEHSEDGTASIIVSNGTQNSTTPGASHQNATRTGCKHENHDVENTGEKLQQMEPQVEVLQIDGNEFLIKVFCEHKPGGFVRLLEALSSLDLQVINVNAARHTCLVSNILRVEKRDSEIICADHVKESLLELARTPLSARTDKVRTSIEYDLMNPHQ